LFLDRILYYICGFLILGKARLILSMLGQQIQWTYSDLEKKKNLESLTLLLQETEKGFANSFTAIKYWIFFCFDIHSSPLVSLGFIENPPSLLIWIHSHSLHHSNLTRGEVTHFQRFSWLWDWWHTQCNLRENLETKHGFFSKLTNYKTLHLQSTTEESYFLKPDENGVTFCVEYHLLNRKSVNKVMKSRRSQYAVKDKKWHIKLKPWHQFTPTNLEKPMCFGSEHVDLVL